MVKSGNFSFLSEKKATYMESSCRWLEGGKMGPFNRSVVLLDLL